MEKAIETVKHGLKKIENAGDLSALPLTLINDVYRTACILEESGTKEGLRFASDSKRRLLDSIIKGKTLTAQLPRNCQTCPNNPDRIKDIMKKRQQKDDLVKSLQLTPDQYKTLEGRYPIKWDKQPQ